jgi:predicted transcriptional regulator YdeE
VGRNFLDKGEVGAMGLKEGAQAGEIRHVIGIEGEEGEERPLGLAIISMNRRRHLDWNQKCAEKGE